MSIFRNIVANSMQDARAADTVEIATTPDLANQQGVTFTVNQASLEDGERMVTISLADGRELAAWLIEHCVTGEPFVPDVSDQVRERLANSPRAEYRGGGGGGGAFGGQGGAGGSSYVVGAGGVAHGGNGGQGGVFVSAGGAGGGVSSDPFPKMCNSADPHESHRWGAEGQFKCAGAS